MDEASSGINPEVSGGSGCCVAGEDDEASFALNLKVSICFVPEIQYFT